MFKATSAYATSSPKIRLTRLNASHLFQTFTQTLMFTKTYSSLFKMVFAFSLIKAFCHQTEEPRPEGNQLRPAAIPDLVSSRSLPPKYLRHLPLPPNTRVILMRFFLSEVPPMSRLVVARRILMVKKQMNRVAMSVQREIGVALVKNSTHPLETFMKVEQTT